MYVYQPERNKRQRFEVGFYDPRGEWHIESEEPTAAQAAHRVAWLNGSKGAPLLPDLLTTEELAALLGVRAQTVRKGHSQDGEYFGVMPVKLPNKRLGWPRSEVEKMMRAATETEADRP